MSRGSKSVECPTKVFNFDVFTTSKILKNHQNFEDVWSESAIFDDFSESRESSSLFRDPPIKRKVKADRPPNTQHRKICRNEDVSNESANSSLQIEASKMFARRKSTLRAPGDAHQNNYNPKLDAGNNVSHSHLLRKQPMNTTTAASAYKNAHYRSTSLPQRSYQTRSYIDLSSGRLPESLRQQSLYDCTILHFRSRHTASPSRIARQAQSFLFYKLKAAAPSLAAIASASHTRSRESRTHTQRSKAGNVAPLRTRTRTRTSRPDTQPRKDSPLECVHSLAEHETWSILTATTRMTLCILGMNM